jgi:hypothetical protein
VASDPLGPKPLSDRHVEQVADRAARSAVIETFRVIGVDIADIDSVNSLRDDLRHAHRQRVASEDRSTTASRTVIGTIGTLIGAMISAVIAWLLYGSKHP